MNHISKIAKNKIYLSNGATILIWIIWISTVLFSATSSYNT
ncbi:MAG: hypothetical protein J6M45_06580 [Pseudobutyrivibrio sp.]|nr:hypothetical protein [Pseudobutyrivibrio sp.]